MNHDDKMRKVAYDSGARIPGGSPPTTRMGGSVVSLDALRRVVGMCCAIAGGATGALALTPLDARCRKDALRPYSHARSPQSVWRVVRVRVDKMP